MKKQMSLIFVSLLLLAGCGGGATNDALMQRADMAEQKSVKKVFKVQPGQWGNAIIVAPAEQKAVVKPSKKMAKKVAKRKAPPLEFVMYLLTLKRS